MIVLEFLHFSSLMKRLKCSKKCRTMHQIDFYTIFSIKDHDKIQSKSCPTLYLEDIFWWFFFLAILNRQILTVICLFAGLFIAFFGRKLSILLFDSDRIRKNVNTSSTFIYWFSINLWHFTFNLKIWVFFTFLSLSFFLSPSTLFVHLIFFPPVDNLYTAHEKEKETRQQTNKRTTDQTNKNMRTQTV